MRIHEINTLEWDELVIPTSDKLSGSEGGNEFGLCVVSIWFNGKKKNPFSCIRHERLLMIKDYVYIIIYMCGSINL